MGVEVNAIEDSWRADSFGLLVSLLRCFPFKNDARAPVYLSLSSKPEGESLVAT